MVRAVLAALLLLCGAVTNAWAPPFEFPCGSSTFLFRNCTIMAGTTTIALGTTVKTTFTNAAANSLDVVYLDISFSSENASGTSPISLRVYPYVTNLHVDDADDALKFTKLAAWSGGESHVTLFTDNGFHSFSVTAPAGATNNVYANYFAIIKP